MPRRIITLTTAAAAALVSAAYAWLRYHQASSAGDLSFPVCAARQLTGDPYRACQLGLDPASGLPYPLNPLTTALIAWPIAQLPVALIAPAAVLLMAGLLMAGLARTGEPWRAYALLSASYGLCVHYVQWAPLVLAAWYLPWLWPVALLAKPHAALPVAVMRWRRWPWGLVVVVVVGLLSLAIRPGWPGEWLGSIRGYSGGPALLQPWGPLLLLALWRWRDPRARYLLLCALAPLRGLYDLLILFALPQGRRGMLALVAASWAAAWLGGGLAAPDAPGAVVLWAAALALVLRPATRPPSSAA